MATPVQPIYRKPRNPEDAGNPFVEALPPLASDKVIVQRLRRKIEYQQVEQSLDAASRLEALDRLDSWIIPQPEYLPTFRMVEKAILDSYRARNPFSATTNHYLHYLNPDDTKEAPDTGRPKSLAKAGTIVGLTGVGKSRMLERVLDYYPQVFGHMDYQGSQMGLKQVIWLKVTCLDGMSLRGLCFRILGALDEALGREYTKPASTIDALSLQIERQLRLNFVGIVAIDELQELDAGGSVGADRITAFLLNLIDRAGVPILLCGNPKLLKVVTRQFRIARRAEQAGYVEIDAMSPKTWGVFVKHMWKHQWTDVYNELTPDLVDELYVLTAGIADFAIKTFKGAQALVIGSGDERITPQILREARDAYCPLTSTGLDSLGKEQFSSGTVYYEDLYLRWPQTDTAPSTQPLAKRSTSATSARRKACGKSSLGDLTRPQHPEFFEKLVEARDNPTLRDVMRQTDLMRSMSEGSVGQDVIDEDILLEEPLIALPKLLRLVENQLN